jgi:THO complex subunit 4
MEAIREFDGANANGIGCRSAHVYITLMQSIGQPIRLTQLPSGPGPRRNPFDSAILPGRSLADRITAPSGRSRSFSPGRSNNLDDDDAARKGIDRYVPGRRSRSPVPRRRGGGRRPGARREGGGREQQDSSRGGTRRPKKTQEELDAEMEDYFGGSNKPEGEASNGAPAAHQRTDDIEMDLIE